MLLPASISSRIPARVAPAETVPRLSKECKKLLLANMNEWRVWPQTNKKSREAAQRLVTLGLATAIENSDVCDFTVEGARVARRLWEDRCNGAGA